MAKTYRHLVIPDTHFGPRNKNEIKIVEAICFYIEETKPDRIIHIGDIGDFESFCTLGDPGDADDIEMSTYGDDFEHVFGAVYNIGQAAKMVGATLDITLGNHEHRVARKIHRYPRLKKTLNLVSDCGLDDWRITPYGRSRTIDGIMYLHCPMSKMGRPMTSHAGVKRFTIGAKADAVVYGHTHAWSAPFFEIEAGHTLKPAINCGCLFEGHGAYMDRASVCYWRGLTTLTVTKGSPPDIETISMKRLLKEYG